eukprot:GABV01002239.1.p1 GENE.GABV01002239.1~~GABV01002239.1.p1  ORF type:complete len:163 (+),score=31.58 GABV01002239.1:128-616(+)
MGFPSEGKEGVYRNPMPEVQRFFNTRHPGHYWIYNLCSERSYDPGKFNGWVTRFPFDDHNCPRFDDLPPFCERIDEFLCADEGNVAVLHCKAGKGRTGLIICVYLLHTCMWHSAEEALEFYGFARTKNKKALPSPVNAATSNTTSDTFDDETQALAHCHPHA